MLLRCVQENTLTYQSDCNITLFDDDYFIKGIIACNKLLLNFSLIQNQSGKYTKHNKSYLQ